MRLFLSLLILGFAQDVQAQGLRSDAFGFYTREDDIRENWSGERTICDGSQCTSKFLKNKNTYVINGFFGQKSLLAGKDNAMSLGLFQDEFGNLVRNSQANASFDDNAISKKFEVKDGLGFAAYQANQIARLYNTSIFSDQTQSGREIYRIIPDTTSIKPNLIQATTNTSQGMVTKIETNPLFDQYSNQAPIGMLSTIIIEDEKNRYTYTPITTKSGVATEMINTTTMRGTYRYKIYTPHQSSDEGKIIVKSKTLTIVQSLDAVLESETQILDTNFHGIMTNLNHLVQDGVLFQITAKQSNGKKSTIESWSLNGNIEARFALYEKAFPVQLTLKSEFGNLSYFISSDQVSDAP